MQRNIKTLNRKVLIVSDSADEIGDIQYLLSDEYGSCLKAITDRDGIRIFDAERPALLILAYDEVELAEVFYQMLLDRSEQIQSAHHQTLLLCKNNESAKAYELCKLGTFHDYVADRPLYDPFRLRLSVSHAFKRYAQSSRVAFLNHKLDKIESGLNEFQEFLNQEISAGEGQHQRTVQAFNAFTRNVNMHLSELQGGVAKSPESQEKSSEISEKIDQLKASIETGSKATEQEIDRSGKLLDDMKDQNEKRVATLKEETRSEHQVTAMIVDDDEFFRDIFVTMLRDAGINPIGAEDGKSALARLQHTTPDLIFLDYNMPDWDGIETLRRLKANLEYAPIPVIMMTGVSEREVVRDCLKNGAIDYVVKPGERAVILAKINEAVNK